MTGRRPSSGRPAIPAGPGRVALPPAPGPGRQTWSTTIAADLPHGRINLRTSIPFLALHLVPLLAVFTGVPWTAWVLFAVTYWTRMFFITAGFHRYFSHRSFRTGRAFQFVLAFGGGAAAQKSALWWAGHHRMHHRHSDTELDPHTPRKGFWWSHVGWILSDETSERPAGTMKDFERFPELRFLDRHQWIPPWALALACLAVGGWPGLLIGFFLSTVVLWHSTFLINSLAHVWGSRRFDTTDTSRNNPVLALLTMGEGWHNNHHRQGHVCRQGLRWYEVDATWYVLWTLERLGVIWGVRRPRGVAADAEAGEALEVVAA